ncbi:sporulation and spore germination protein [Natranaerovirga hydrolytica]|uniref:Sporulation and spore germination protein n=1 Tax=Natranaerovirga hydrolytica TaxID=680378 RepID=A0A4R1MLG4_9FIRM|nr:Gmad2 immunoglobulin-like domain-containing protein [Natranaerovirga hydrolytica]TCK92692.1 sporulation and spore germination protein [Natranaerovirga hydrolytica]
MKKLMIILVIVISMFALSACEQGDLEDEIIEQSDGTENQDEDLDESNLSPNPSDEEEEVIEEVVLYFPDNDLMHTYRVKSQISIGAGESIEEEALKAWMEGPEHEKLMGLIGSSVIIEYVEDVDGIAHVSFSKEIQEVNLGSGGELMLIEQVSMIMSQFGYDRTQLLVEGEIGESLIGHIYTGEPYGANDPENYLWIDEIDSGEIALQNVAFRIYEPAPHTEVTDTIVVRGLARVYEATIQYEFEDGHNILDKGFTTASEGAPGWGEFEITIDIEGEVANNTGSIILYEESMKDGSRMNELIIPVEVAK